MQKLKHVKIVTEEYFTPQQWDVILAKDEDLFMLIEINNNTNISGGILVAEHDKIRCFNDAIAAIKINARNIFGSVRVTRIENDSDLKCECKVCGKPFEDRLELYEHYNETHNREQD